VEGDLDGGATSATAREEIVHHVAGVGEKGEGEGDQEKEFH
jgi:hypothetical protein